PALNGTMTSRAAELQPGSPQRESGVPGVPSAAGATPAAAPGGPPGGTFGRAGRGGLPPRVGARAAGRGAARRAGPAGGPGRRAGGARGGLGGGARGAGREGGRAHGGTDVVRRAVRGDQGVAERGPAGGVQGVALARAQRDVAADEAGGGVDRPPIAVPATAVG